jgi:S-formylglutathione hydrolase FrmB
MIMRTRFALVTILTLALFPRLDAQDTVTVLEDSLGSTNVNAMMKFLVVLPRDYHRTEERHPTVYLLHGFGGNRFDWVHRSDLVRYAAAYRYLFVCPDAHNSWYTNTPDGTLKYEQYILDELIPYVQKKYRTLGTRHGRIVAGLSMGGYGALKFGLKYPDRFIFAASFSGALYVPTGSRPDNKEISESLARAFGPERSEHWTNNDLSALADKATPASLPYLYLATGKDDSFTRIVESNRNFIEKLRTKGILYEYHETPGGHTWQYWDKALRDFLKRLVEFDPLRP